MDTRPDDRDPVLERALTALRNTPPATDLWPSIAERMAPRLPKGAMVVRWPVALAAGVALAVTTAGGTMLVMHARGAASVGANQAALTATAVPAAFTPADAALAQAISDLETAVRAEVQKLDPVARESINKSLAALDQAIADATAQRRATPDDPRAAHYLTSTLRKKLELLRTVSQLTAQRS